MEKSVTVLVVDDESVTRMMVRRVLFDAGYDVVEAETGAQALQICAESPPDAVLMDVRMPVMNGFDACRGIRRLPRCSHVPVLMLTALDDVMAVTLAFEAGATDFITKPINWVLLGHRVRYVLRASRDERALRATQQTLARAHKIARLSQWSYDTVSQAWHNTLEMRDMLGMSGPIDVTLDDVAALLPEEERCSLRDLIDRICATQTEQQLELRLPTHRAGPRYLILSANLALDEAGGPRSIFGIAQDVTDRRDAEARLSYQAHFDPLTGLPNRVLFRDRVNTAIAAAQRGGTRFAILEIKAQGPSKAAAVAGPAASDQAVRAVATRIRDMMRERDTLCRMDGDRFALLMSDLNDDVDAAAMARRLVDVFSAPLKVDDWEVVSEVVVGLALYPADGDRVDSLQAHAASALARAESTGAGGFQFYTDDIQQRVAAQIETQVALFRGLERNEFVLHYQPQIDLRSGRVVGVEALLRWQRPGQGLLMPDSFIGILEESGLINDAGDWVLRSSCEGALAQPLGLAVNVSPRQFISPRLAERMARILDESGFPPQRLEVEITEQAVLADEAHAMDTLAALARLGVRIALDDYGIGFSSLQRLKQLPLHKLKIDKFFVTSLLGNAKDSAIVHSTIDLCHELGIEVVAEGVEDVATLRRLQSLGCDYGQGYGISRPLPMDQLHAWLARHDPAAIAASGE